MPKRSNAVVYDPIKKTKRRFKKKGFRHRKKLSPKSHLRVRNNGKDNNQKRTKNNKAKVRR